MMNCRFQLSTVDSYVMTGRDYIYFESMRVSECVFCLGTFCVYVFLSAAWIYLHNSLCEYEGKRMTRRYE